jgi:heme exporter protein B
LKVAVLGAAGRMGRSVLSCILEAEAMVAQARSRGALFAVLLMPVLVPGLFFAVQLTRVAVAGEPPGEELQALLLYDATLTVAGLMLFPVVWNP